jgi:Mrp family chromosome partitioning ATPase
MTYNPNKLTHDSTPVALIASYALWNNKGGVGKSTITFHLATRYAQLHPERHVVVVDMCP